MTDTDLPRFVHGAKAKARAHLLKRNGRTMCKAENSQAFLKQDLYYTSSAPHRSVCQICYDLVERAGRLHAYGLVTKVHVTPRVDWSDLNIYDQTVPPWEEQVVIGRHPSEDAARAAWT